MKIGYSRVSAVSRQPKIQHDALESYGCRKLYTDVNTGENNEQPELDRLLGHLKPLDTLVVWRLDRLSSNIGQLYKTIEILQAKKVTLVSLEDGFEGSEPDGWQTIKKHLRWSINENLPAGTAKIHLWLDNGYGQVVVENCKTGVRELDDLAAEAVKIIGCGPEEGYPGFDVANYLVDTFGGSIELVEYSPPQ